MAKKSTTGGPRTRRTTTDDVQRRKQYISRAEKEKRWQKRVVVITGVLVAISIIVLIGAIINEQVFIPRSAITTVNGDKISTSDFQDRVKFVRWLTANQIRQIYYYVGGDIDTLENYASDSLTSLQRPLVMGSEVLQEMEEELVLEQGAKDLGITVDQARVDQEIEDYMAENLGLTHPDRPTATPTTVPTAAPTSLVPSATPLPTDIPPTATPELDENGTPIPPTEAPTATATLEPADIIATITSEEDNWFEIATDASGAPSSAGRDMFYYQALREAVAEKLAEDIPTEELQVNARHILFSFNDSDTTPTDEEKAAALEQANAALAALQDGEPFADLAKELSDDTGSAASGGELGWASPDNYVAAFKDAVENSELGAIVGPIETEYGYHIIQVNGREIRPISATELSSRQDDAYQAWLDALVAEAKIDRNDDWLNRIPEEPTYNDLLGDILPIN